ncbi:MAG: amidohydrolase family protein [Alphaproteobacteria bacterium]
MAETTVIRDVDYLVAWDKASGCQRYLRGADIAFSGSDIVHVGAHYRGQADRTIDGRKLMVMPGLINMHNHTNTMPAFKGVREELGSKKFYMSALYDGWPLFYPEPEDQHWNSHFAYAECLLSGVTTVVDMCRPFPGWIETMAQSGLRGYIAPIFESARWYTDNGYQVKYRWAEDDGRKAMDLALKTMDQAEAHNSGRLTGMVSPMAADTCSVELIRASLAEARRRKRPMQLHVGEAAVEFHEMTRRNGMSQVQWLHQHGLLGPELTLGHGIFLDHHSWLHWATNEDVKLLAAHGCSVSHCPIVFSRYGITLENFGSYREAGINMTIGTDTHPHNMIEEMRAAITLARVSAENMFNTLTSDVFHAATAGGAKALGRDDIGGLAVGMKADMVLVDLDCPAMQPVYDPLRCLIFTAADRGVRDVFVDGVQVVADRKVLTLDQAGAAAHISDMQKRIMAKVPERHYAKLTAEQVSPLTLPESRA